MWQPGIAVVFSASGWRAEMTKARGTGTNLSLYYGINPLCMMLPLRHAKHGLSRTQHTLPSPMYGQLRLTLTLTSARNTGDSYLPHVAVLAVGTRDCHIRCQHLRHRTIRGGSSGEFAARKQQRQRSPLRVGHATSQSLSVPGCCPPSRPDSRPLVCCC